MLFRIILQKSHAIPVYVLLVVTDFYYRLDKWEEALEVNRAAFAKVEAQETQLKFVILNNIGKSLSKQEHYREAESIHRRCLEWRERVLGEDHKDTLWSIYWLAYVLHEQGKYVDAEALLRRCLKVEERILGKEHKYTLISIYMLACVLYEQGKYVDAEALLRRCLEGEERILGKEHKDTLLSKSLLARILGEQ
jgi:tetratricopeptide (TPR) repeat protein